MNHYQAALCKGVNGYYYIPVASGCCSEGLGFMFFYKQCNNLNNPAEREEIFGWYREYTEKIIGFFKPIIKKL